jgi:hypothetical protein
MNRQKSTKVYTFVLFEQSKRKMKPKDKIEIRGVRIIIIER